MHLHIVVVEELLIPLTWSAEAFSVSAFEGTISSVAFRLREVSSSESVAQGIFTMESI